MLGGVSMIIVNIFVLFEKLIFLEIIDNIGGFFSSVNLG